MNRRNFLKRSLFASILLPLGFVIPKKPSSTVAKDVVFFVGDKNGSHIKIDDSGFTVVGDRENQT